MLIWFSSGIWNRKGVIINGMNFDIKSIPVKPVAEYKAFLDEGLEGEHFPNKKKAELNIFCNFCQTGILFSFSDSDICSSDQFHEIRNVRNGI